MMKIVLSACVKLTSMTNSRLWLLRAIMPSIPSA